MKQQNSMDNEERVLPLKKTGRRELKNILFLIKTNIWNKKSGGATGDARRNNWMPFRGNENMKPRFFGGSIPYWTPPNSYFSLGISDGKMLCAQLHRMAKHNFMKPIKCAAPSTSILFEIVSISGIVYHIGGQIAPFPLSHAQTFASLIRAIWISEYLWYTRNAQVAT